MSIDVLPRKSEALLAAICRSMAPSNFAALKKEFGSTRNFPRGWELFHLREFIKELILNGEVAETKLDDELDRNGAHSLKKLLNSPSSGGIGEDRARRVFHCVSRLLIKDKPSTVAAALLAFLNYCKKKNLTFYVSMCSSSDRDAVIAELSTHMQPLPESIQSGAGESSSEASIASGLKGAGATVVPPLAAARASLPPITPTAALVLQCRNQLPLTPPPKDGEHWEIVQLATIPKSFMAEATRVQRASWGKNILVVNGRGHKGNLLDRAFIHEFDCQRWWSTEFVPKRLQSWSRPISYWSFVEAASPNENLIIVGDQCRVYTWEWETIDTHLSFVDTVTEFRPGGDIHSYTVRPSKRKRLPFDDVGSHRFLDYGQCHAFAPNMERFVHRSGVIDDAGGVGMGHSFTLWERPENSSSERKAGIVERAQFRECDHHGYLSPICWSPSGRFLFNASKGFILLKESTPAIKLEAGCSFLSGAWHPVQDILALSVLSPRNEGNQSWIGRIELFDAATGEIISKSTLGHHQYIHSVDWSPDGRWIATCGEDGTVGLWDLMEDQTHSLHGNGTPPGRAQFSPCGKRLAVFDLAAKETVSIYDLTTRREIVRFPGHSMAFGRSVWHRDGRMIATSKDPFTVEVRRLRV